MSAVMVFAWISADELVKRVEALDEDVRVFVPIDPSLTDKFVVPWTRITRKQIKQCARSRIDRTEDSYGVHQQGLSFYVIGCKKE